MGVRLSAALFDCDDSFRAVASAGQRAGVVLGVRGADDFGGEHGGAAGRIGFSGERARLAIMFIPALIVSVWFTVGLTRGQASVLMTWLVIAAIFWEHKGKTRAAAACLGGAVLLKAFALTLLCYYVWRGRQKMAAASLVAIFLGGLVLPSAVFGFRGNIHYIGEWTQEVAAPALGSESSRTHSELYDQLLSMERPRNQDLGSVMQRLFKGNQTRRW